MKAPAATKPALRSAPRRKPADPAKLRELPKPGGWPFPVSAHQEKK